MSQIGIGDFLNEVYDRLEMPVARRVAVTQELLSHYRDNLEDLRPCGVEEAQAQREAVTRLGSPEEIAARLNSVSNSASWKSAILCATPFFGWALCLSLPDYRVRLVLGSMLAGVIIIGSAQALIHRTRPAWLATWLAASYLAITHVVSNIATEFGLALFIGLSAALACIICWKGRERRWRAIGYGSAMLALYLFALRFGGNTHASSGIRVLGFAAGLGFFIAAMAVIYTFAVRVFSDPAHGSAWRATLFLFAFCLCLKTWPAARPHLDVYLPVLSFVTAGLTVVGFVLTPVWRNKMLWLAGGLILKIGLFDALVAGPYNDLTNRIDFDPIQHVTRVLIASAFAFALAAAPMLSERADREGRRREGREVVRG